MSLEAFPIGNSPLVPAPHIPEAVPHSIVMLLNLLDEREEDIDLLFAIANLYFYQNDLLNSVKFYKKILKLDRDRVEVLSNLAVVLYVLGKKNEAKKFFKNSLEVDSGYEHSLYYFSHLKISLFEFSEAKKLLIKLVENNFEHVKGLSLLAYIFDHEKEYKLARKHYEKIFLINPEMLWVNHKLCMIDFQKGKEAFLTEDYSLAFSIWSEANKNYKSSFVSNREIAKQFAELQNDFNKNKKDEKLIELYRETKFSDPNISANFFHEIFSAFFFSIGLFPEFYLSQDEIYLDRQRWEESLQKRGDHPYAYFKIAIGMAFEGKLEEAFSKFRYCEDTLLPKKLESLEIVRIVRFIKSLLRIPEGRGISNAPDQEWQKVGFTESLEKKLWQGSGFEPDEAMLWHTAGFLPNQAKEWSAANITLEDAKKWYEHSFRSVRNVKIWKNGGLSPEEAKSWENYFKDNRDKAVQFYNAGLKDPKAAFEWLKVFNLTWDAVSWNDQGFSPEEAQGWFRKGVSDPFEAKRLSKKEKFSTEEVDI